MIIGYVLYVITVYVLALVLNKKMIDKLFEGWDNGSKRKYQK